MISIKLPWFLSRKKSNYRLRSRETATLDFGATMVAVLLLSIVQLKVRLPSGGGLEAVLPFMVGVASFFHPVQLATLILFSFLIFAGPMISVELLTTVLIVFLVVLFKNAFFSYGLLLDLLLSFLSLFLFLFGLYGFSIFFPFWFLIEVVSGSILLGLGLAYLVRRMYLILK